MENTVSAPLFSNDVIVLGILVVLLAFVMVTSSSEQKIWKTFYKYFPPILACYLFPSLLNSAGIISGEVTQLYSIAANYLLPASLILLCLGIDLQGIINLGPKALIMFFAATTGIILGGPVAILIVGSIAPELVTAPEGEEVWKAFSTVAGSWIGGSANQTAMKEIYGVSDNLFGTMLIIDIIVANIWTGFLLYGATITQKIDRWLQADTSAITDLQDRVEKYRASISRMPTLKDTLVILAIGFGGTAFSQWLADFIVPFMKNHADTLEAWRLTALNSNFFWVVVLATTVGVVMSFTRYKQMEGAGASRMGSVFIYLLVATIGMKMDVFQIFDHLGLFFIGVTWMLTHVIILIGTAKLIKAPFFFAAVGSQANVGGAASAPVVAAAFNPALAPVGVLLAVLGYALGTYGAIISAQLMQLVSP